ncbi:hypothetical protein EGH82_11905 [Vibrio ponticus]|uniref:Uncharacterized protein n=1 Tax=Vibrio ponticus TaxID=265668 RepID=A0A3N3DZP0_9VIBR|nr:hypothetical protein [Vibrio ponticus]ROV59859.1 hypothetical protein EGH82_11905 [Vibrio ponticus]
MKKWLLTTLLLLSFSSVSFSQTVLPKAAIDSLVAPTLILSQGRYGQAADGFHNQSNLALSLERKLGTQLMWQVAGLAEGLAAIAAEKNNDPIAYEYWANSVRYFLMSGSSWQEMQSMLHQEFEQSNSRLQVSMASNEGGITVDNAWLELFSLVEVWQERLSYFSYRQPSSELAQRAALSQSGGLEQVGGAGTESNGSQLRQYAPTNRLKLKSGFTRTQTFNPVEPASESIQQRETQNRAEQGSVQIEREQTESQPTVLASPLGVEPKFIEQDSNLMLKNQSKINGNAEIGETAKFRGNLETQSSQGVSATQRRSFVPTEK